MKRGNPWNSLVISSPRSSTKDEVRRYIKIIDFSQISRAFRAINLPLTGPTFFQLRFGRALEKQEESRSFVNRRLEKSNSRAEGNYDFSSSVSFCVRFPWGILIYHVSPRNPACRAATRAISVRSAHSTRRDESQFRENVRGGWIIIQRRRGARLRERVCGGFAARILERRTMDRRCENDHQRNQVRSSFANKADVVNCPPSRRLAPYHVKVIVTALDNEQRCSKDSAAFADDRFFWFLFSPVTRACNRYPFAWKRNSSHCARREPLPEAYATYLCKYLRTRNTMRVSTLSLLQRECFFSSACLAKLTRASSSFLLQFLFICLAAQFC